MCTKEVFTIFNPVFDYAYDHIDEEVVNHDGVIAFDPTLLAPLDVIVPTEAYANFVTELLEMKKCSTMAVLMEYLELDLYNFATMMFLPFATIERWIANDSEFAEVKKSVIYFIFTTRVLSFLHQKSTEDI